MEENTNPAPAGGDDLDAGLSLDQAAAQWAQENPETEAPAPKAKAAPKEQPSESDDEPAEGANEETESPAEDDEGQEPETKFADEDVYVKFEDGESVPISEVKHAFSQYRRESQEIAKERGDLKALSDRLTQGLEAAAGILAETLPPEPDPQLAITNPGLHYQQRLAYDAAMQRIMGVLQFSEEAKGAAKSVSEAEFATLMRTENDTLIRKMPHLKDAKRMEAFDRKVTEYAKSLGFTEEEIKSTANHRVRMMAYDAAYAREYRAAAAKAKGKTQSAAPMLPAKQRQHPNSTKALEGVNAMKKLQSSGRMEDAIKAYTLLAQE